jgi:hypothetical protein
MLVAPGFALYSRRFLRRFPRLLSIGLLLALPALPLPACAASAATVDPDASLAAARDAMRAGDGERLAQIAPALAGNVLEPYVDYWRLALRVRAGEADEAAVRGFYARHTGTYLADRLRGDWLLALAASRSTPHTTPNGVRSSGTATSPSCAATRCSRAMRWRSRRATRTPCTRLAECWRRPPSRAATAAPRSQTGCSTTA